MEIRVHILREGVYQRLTERDRKCVTRSRRENDTEREREGDGRWMEKQRGQRGRFSRNPGR